MSTQQFNSMIQYASVAPLEEFRQTQAAGFAGSSEDFQHGFILEIVSHLL